ncbi:hypothetical protein ACHAW5_009930 [Stephanodiscus triporus]|uniref:Uncharacterized protein n=1 Tax=Stephanodiscus triporus TaxID=2934178 RepID=A0ABD3N7Z9_9STRA
MGIQQQSAKDDDDDAASPPPPAPDLFGNNGNFYSLSTEDEKTTSPLIPTASFCDAWPEIILFMMKGLFEIMPENDGGGGDRRPPLQRDSLILLFGNKLRGVAI